MLSESAVATRLVERAAVGDGLLRPRQRRDRGPLQRHDAGRTAHDIAARSGLSVATVQAILGAASVEGTVSERERGWVKKLG